MATKSKGQQPKSPIGDNPPGGARLPSVKVKKKRPKKTSRGK